MANGIVQVAPDSTGKKVDTSELTVGTNTVERQRIVISDDATAAALAAVKNSTPGTSDYGVVVRTAGQTIIQGLQPNATVGAIAAASTSVPSTTGLDVQQYNIATVRISGTYAGVNITFEQSDNGGTTWYATQGARCDTAVIESVSGALTNTTRAWDIPIGGANRLRVRSTAWASGTANIAIAIQSFAYDPCPGVVAQGPATNGTSVLGNPVMTGGFDGTNARMFRTDTNGYQYVLQSYSAAGAVLVSAATTNATLAKSVGGYLLCLSATNLGATPAYLKLFNLNVAPTVGTSTPMAIYQIPANGNLVLQFGAQGMWFASGISYCITGAAAIADTTAVAANQILLNLTFQ